MKKSSLLFLVYIIGLSLAPAQEKNFRIEGNYPITLGDFGNEYAGITDIGVDIYFKQLKPARVGISLNAGLLNDDSDSQFNSQTDLNIVSLQPRLNLELTTLSDMGLYPSIGAGYSIWFFSFKRDSDSPLEPEKWNERGLNINLGLVYYLNKTFFLQAQYDYLNLKSFGLTTFDSFGNRQEVNRKTSGGLIKIGIGVSL